MPSSRAHPSATQLAEQTQAALITQLRQAEQLKQHIHALLERAKDDPQAQQALLALEAQTRGPWGQNQKRLLAALQQLAQHLPAPPAADAQGRRANRRPFF
ncbi:MAG: hypothetical protein JO171_02835 [Paludibacterium sp.]|uniref:hypothetical protein n=1 Tax=Paludibacterium sp. TaxID=1917523 RepID=UPI0025E5DFA5|nr:hypothetical protein [Paludibacterium sp.]MBV8046061.1 hypothetical protein [Paludibacterium sp.]MBV8646150.1 hypothetical protein [Paludibacterium sp.]